MVLPTNIPSDDLKNCESDRKSSALWGLISPVLEKSFNRAVPAPMAETLRAYLNIFLLNIFLLNHRLDFPDCHSVDIEAHLF